MGRFKGILPSIEIGATLVCEADVHHKMCAGSSQMVKWWIRLMDEKEGPRVPWKRY
jgi:hypothetical protein